jgi:hypothetical protein
MLGGRADWVKCLPAARSRAATRTATRPVSRHRLNSPTSLHGPTPNQTDRVEFGTGPRSGIAGMSPRRLTRASATRHACRTPPCAEHSTRADPRVNRPPDCHRVPREHYAASRPVRIGRRDIGWGRVEPGERGTSPL